MSRWRAESVYLKRYAGSGVINTLVGFSVIFLMMGVGVSPLVSNIAGYSVGFVLGFVVSKKIVFRSNGDFIWESVRYLVSFLLAFTLNLVVLHVLLTWTKLPPVLSQVVAAICYTTSMYCLTRYYVFPPCQAGSEDGK